MAVALQEPEDVESTTSGADGESVHYLGSSDSEAASLESLVWFTQQAGSSCHLVQCTSGSFLVPWCRDTPFSQRHAQRGVGLKADDVLCKRCRGRAPANLRHLLGIFVK